MGNSMYTDAQWKWLHDRFKEGYFLKELKDFAGCSMGNMCHHWRRLKLGSYQDDFPPLNRDEFNALGGAE